MIRRFSPVCLAAVVLAGCASSPDDTMRVCDASGCSERSTDSASFDPSSTVPDADPEGRLPALEELAREKPAAAHDLALRYLRGDGIRQNSYQAIKWMQDAAERGNLEAQKALGRIYLVGLEEMGPDPIQAQRWLKVAADRGDAESQELLAEANAARKAAKEDYEERERDRLEARRRQYRHYLYRDSDDDYYYRWRRGGWRRGPY